MKKMIEDIADNAGAKLSKISTRRVYKIRLM